MPEFTHNDRQMLHAETTLWNVVSLLDDVSAGAFSKRVQSLMLDANKLAIELRDYNDQFEEVDE